MKIKLLDCFSWVWWFHLALEQSIWKENIECIWFSEIDKYAIQVYKQHFPQAKDLWSISELDIDKLEDFDLLTWWFPCQDVSLAWKQNLEWWRTVLVEYLLQILEKKQPKYFVFENVKGLMSKKFDTFRESIFDRIQKAGYHISYEVLNTKNFWLPQSRERVFIVWSLMRDDIRYFLFPQWQELTTFLKDILEEEVDEKFYMNEKQIAWVNKSNYQDRKPYNINKTHIWTLKIWWDVKRIEYTPIKWRYVIPTEYCRLQWFPDNWNENVSNSQRYKQMWNAISVPVVKAIFDNLF